MKAFSDIFKRLPESTRNSLTRLFTDLNFTESQKLEAVKEEADLIQWKENSYAEAADIKKLQERKDGRGRDEYIAGMREYMHKLRAEATDYSGFFPERKAKAKAKTVVEDKPLVLGKCPCPVDGEKTRCCKLTTLDTAMQCAFGCAYCSVQAFYNENQIMIAGHLEERLKELPISEGVWHIGTGQASDSLLLGDDYKTLSGLSAFAEEHNDIVIELKSKSNRDVFDHAYPRNMIFTWSLNAPTIIDKEEHFTAKLEDRLKTARKAADRGNLVGFHIHPMVYFKGWRDEYSEVVRKIEELFSPDEVAMVSIGTLTFTKAVLKRLREMGEESKVLEMELTKTAGKYSYPIEKKREMFSHVYSSFSDKWHENVFFYLCMEDPSLWLPVLGHEYQCDREFEEDMKKHYFAKIRQNSISNQSQ